MARDGGGPFQQENVKPGLAPHFSAALLLSLPAASRSRDGLAIEVATKEVMPGGSKRPRRARIDTHSGHFSTRIEAVLARPATTRESGRGFAGRCMKRGSVKRRTRASLFLLQILNIDSYGVVHQLHKSFET